MGVFPTSIPCIISEPLSFFATYLPKFRLNKINETLIHFLHLEDKLYIKKSETKKCVLEYNFYRVNVNAALPPGREATNSKGRGENEYKRVSTGSSNASSLSSAVSTESQIFLLLKAEIGEKRSLFFASAKVNNSEFFVREIEGKLDDEVEGRRKGEAVGLIATETAFTIAILKNKTIVYCNFFPSFFPPS